MKVYKCPQCGANLTAKSEKCAYCGALIFISSISHISEIGDFGIQKYLNHFKSFTGEHPESAEGYLGMGICYLALKLFPLAKKAFEKVIEKNPHIAFSYYYNCLSIVAGRRVKNLSINEVQTIESYLQAAIKLDDKNHIFKLLLLLIKLDYYIYNGLKDTEPQCLFLFHQIDLSKIVDTEFEMLKSAVITKDIKLITLKKDEKDE